MLTTLLIYISFLTRKIQLIFKNYGSQILLNIQCYIIILRTPFFKVSVNQKHISYSIKIRFCTFLKK